jgi:hypothetical protein
VNLTSDDPAVRTAAITNLMIESLVAVLSLGLFAYQVQRAQGVDIGEAIARKVKEWRVRMYGPPPPSEEDIQRYAKLTVIEATRIVRQAES